MGASVGVDVGGTFTDLVAVVDGELVTAKVPSVRGSEARGIGAALRASGVGEVDVLAHGTTVATNALLERRGARTALVTTEGFRDVIEIGRQARASLYDLAAHHPAPLVPRELRFTVRERMGPDGVLVPLDEGSLSAAVEAVRAAGVEAVAVCLLFSFLHPDHERRVGEALREALPGTRVSLSVELLPEFREYERCSTTVANAYLAPALSAYLAEIEPSPLVMQSSGGVVDAATAAERPAACVLSGPAAGVAGAAFVAGLARARDVLTFDMGGTSTDVAAVLGGSAQVTARVGRRRRPDPVPDGRHPHDRGGRRLDRLVGRRRRASHRAALRGRLPGAGVLRAGRRGADRDRCEPGPRPPPGRCGPRRGDPARPVARRARAWSGSGWTRPRPPKA